MLKKSKRFPGFTLIEILVVIALIAILAAITIIAINPAKNFQDSRNTQRSANVNEILSAVTQYTSEQGQALADLGTIPLCTATPGFTNIGSGSGLVNLTTKLVDKYIASIPFDPSGGTDADTKYTICQTAGGRVTVAAPAAEGGKTIAVTR